METISQFLGLSHWAIQQIHIYHLHTTSYAEHKALNFWYDKCSDLIDDFYETYQGAFEQRVLSDEHPYIFKNWKSLEDSTMVLTMFRSTLVAVKDELPEAATDLQNIADELLGLTNKTLYLLTLA